MIQVRCNVCGKRYAVPDPFGGKKMRCKQCSAVLEIPVPASTTPESADEDSEVEQQQTGATSGETKEEVRPQTPEREFVMRGPKTEEAAKAAKEPPNFPVGRPQKKAAVFKTGKGFIRRLTLRGRSKIQKNIGSHPDGATDAQGGNVAAGDVVLRPSASYFKIKNLVIGSLVVAVPLLIYGISTMDEDRRLHIPLALSCIGGVCYVVYFISYFLSKIRSKIYGSALVRPMMSMRRKSAIVSAVMVPPWLWYIFGPCLAQNGDGTFGLFRKNLREYAEMLEQSKEIVSTVVALNDPNIWGDAAPVESNGNEWGAVIPDYIWKYDGWRCCGGGPIVVIDANTGDVHPVFAHISKYVAAQSPEQVQHVVIIKDNGLSKRADFAATYKGKPLCSIGKDYDVRVFCLFCKKHGRENGGLVLAGRIYGPAPGRVKVSEIDNTVQIIPFGNDTFGVSYVWGLENEELLRNEVNALCGWKYMFFSPLRFWWNSGK